MTISGWHKNRRRHADARVAAAVREDHSGWRWKAWGLLGEGSAFGYATADDARIVADYFLEHGRHAPRRTERCD